MRTLSTITPEFTPEHLRQLPEPVPTGWPELDSVLDGLMPGLYVLGAISGLGKSTFALQMAEQIARRDKRPVLYFSLEMDIRAIAAKSLSRRIFQNSDRRVQLESRRLMRRWSQAEDPPPALREALEEMERDCATLHIVTPQDEPDPLTAEKIVQTADGFFKEHPESPPPVVMVDYLQIIPAPTGERDIRAAIDMDVQKLRNLTAQGMVVLLISSLNRSSYTKPIELSSFKESGGIEYSADVLLGLQFVSVHRPERKDDGWLQAEKEKSVRDVEISVLKQRYGRSGISIPFRYYAACDTFLPGNTVIAPEEETVDGPVFKINNTLIANRLRFPDKLVWEEAKYGYQAKLTVHPLNKNQQDVETKVRLTAPRPNLLDYWHMMVADAVFTLYLEKIERFKVSDILRRLTGDQQKLMKKPRTDQATGKILGVAGDIAKALEDMSEIKIEIDCKEELARRWAKKNGLHSTEGYSEPGLFQGLFLDLEREDEYYKFPQGPGGGRRAMPLYEYAQQPQMKQILTISLSCLATPKNAKGKPGFSDTKENLMLKHYLARAIKLASGSSMNTLSFTSDYGVFAALGVLPQSGTPEDVRKAQERRCRKYFSHTLAMLRYYIDELGLLKSPRSLPESYKKKNYIKLWPVDIQKKREIDEGQAHFAEHYLMR